MSIIRPVPAGDYKETMNRHQSMTNTKHKEHKWFTTGHSLKRLVKKTGWHKRIYIPYMCMHTATTLASL